ncbi:MAG: OmpA family protein [Candidatus Atribacteria bacterium]|nr:OmpA family protein [Candidatus Atribacteria bacterium]
MAIKVQGYPGSRVVIDGHTDSVGSKEYNQELSVNRAKAVRDYFLTIENLINFQIEIHGYGESQPIAPNETEEGREKNRRVEIIIVP